MRVSGDEIVGGRIDVGKVASSAAGDGDVFPDAFCVLQHDNTATPLPSLNRAKKSCRTTTDNDHIFANQALAHVQELNIRLDELGIRGTVRSIDVSALRDF